MRAIAFPECASLRFPSRKHSRVQIVTEGCPYNGGVRTGGLEISDGLSRMPQVTLRIVIDGREETLSEYLCDWPDCPNVAVTVVGVIRELRVQAVMCPEHARLVRSKDQNSHQG